MNKRDEEVGSPTFGPWRIAFDLCEADYTVSETEHRPCSYSIEGEARTGYEIWTRQKRVTEGGPSGDWSMLFSTCWTGPVAQTPPPVSPPEELPQPQITFPTWTETEPLTCPVCTQGTASRSRIHTDRHVRFPWDTAPTVQTDVQLSQWVTDNSGCAQIPPTTWTQVRQERRTLSCGSGVHRLLYATAKRDRSIHAAMRWICECQPGGVVDCMDDDQ